jgi:hypothetical protein
MSVNIAAALAAVLVTCLILLLLIPLLDRFADFLKKKRRRG